VTGATPVTTVTSGTGYTGTVSWSPTVASTFLGNTAYTATITLSATTGYTFTGVTLNQFTIAGSTGATNSANSGTITGALFPTTTQDQVASPSFTPAAERIPITFNLVGSSAVVGTPVVIATAQAGINLLYNGRDNPDCIEHFIYRSIIINATTTIKSIAVKDQYINSNIISSTYTINQSTAGVFNEGSWYGSDRQ